MTSMSVPLICCMHAATFACKHADRHGGIWMQACTNYTAVVYTACPTPSSVCTPSLCRGPYATCMPMERGLFCSLCACQRIRGRETQKARRQTCFTKVPPWMVQLEWVSGWYPSSPGPRPGTCTDFRTWAVYMQSTQANFEHICSLT